MPDKKYISAQQLLDDSFSLGLKILDSDYRPSFIIGVWRGGTPVAIAVHELLDYFGIQTNHIAIRTSFYSGIEQRENQVKIHGLHYALDQLTANDSVLIVDDVHDTGLSIQKIINDLKHEFGSVMPTIRIAVLYYKPANNKVGAVPDYYIHETDNWLVFPHELSGLSVQEILERKPGIDALRKKLSAQDNKLS